MLVSKNAKICFTPNAKPKICVTHNAKPKPKSVEYRLRWVPNTKSPRWQCTFNFFCSDFICVWWPTQTKFPVEYGLCFIVTLQIAADIQHSIYCHFLKLLHETFEGQNCKWRHQTITYVTEGFHLVSLTQNIYKVCDFCRCLQN